MEGKNYIQMIDSLAGVTALTEEEEGLLKEAADLTGAFPAADECLGVPFVEDRLLPLLNFCEAKMPESPPPADLSLMMTRS